MKKIFSDFKSAFSDEENNRREVENFATSVARRLMELGAEERFSMLRQIEVEITKQTEERIDNLNEEVLRTRMVLKEYYNY